MSNPYYAVSNALGSWMRLGTLRQLKWRNRHADGYAQWEAATSEQRTAFLEECRREEQAWRELQKKARREERENLETAFPEPVNPLEWRELRNLAGLMERDRSLLKRSALVIYRCGAKRPNGKVRGCLLGAVVNLKGDRYWLHQQRTSVDHISGDQITGYLNGERGGWGDATSQIVEESAFEDGSVADWEPGSLREASELGLITGGSLSLHLDIHPAWFLKFQHDYRLTGMNCPHTDARRAPIEIVRDIERLARQRDKTVYLTTEDDARYLENKNAVRNDQLWHQFEHSESPDT